MSAPLCPVVLHLVAVEPRGVGDVARELARREPASGLPAHQAATVTLGRLQREGLVYARGTTRSRRVFRVTNHGRRELAFRRSVARALARA
jgi:DNA-binding PadR family transcriptional regulator